MPDQLALLDELINHEQPRTISSLKKLVDKTGWLLQEIRLERYLGALQGVRIKVTNPYTWQGGWLPIKKVYRYGIFS